MIFVERRTFSSLYRRANGLLVEIPHGPLTKFDLDDHVIQELWQVFPGRSVPDFVDFLRPRLTWPEQADDVSECSDCNEPMYLGHSVDSDRLVCDSCLDDYSSCAYCGETVHQDTTSWTLHDEPVCQSCADCHYSYCDECEGLYHNDYRGDHEHGGCACEPDHLRFAVRNGDDLLRNDRRVTVSLPAGEISETGMSLIGDLIRQAARGLTEANERADLYAFSWEVDEIGSEWQTRQGNFTKRLSRAAHKFKGLKISPELLTAIGNVARDNSLGADFDVEVTRNLNLPAEDFCHESSCWWGGYSESRCTLKSNGGFGLRDFGRYGPQGRAWVMPLKDRDGQLDVTFDAEHADAFVVFNGYGTLSGYAGARIVAAMHGMTYKKIRFSGSPMYINGESGVLVGPEEIVSRSNELDLDLEMHSNLAYAERHTAAA